MDPRTHHNSERIEDDIVAEDEKGLIDGYTREELDAMLDEAEASGMAEGTLDDIFNDLFIKHFCRIPDRADREPDGKSAH